MPAGSTSTLVPSTHQGPCGDRLSAASAYEATQALSLIGAEWKLSCWVISY